MRNFFKPMWDPGGDNDNVAFVEFVDYAAADGCSAVLIGCSDSAAQHRSAGNESCAAVKNVERVGFLVVNLGFATAGAVPDEHRQIRCRHERSTFSDFVVPYESDLWIGCSRTQQNGADCVASQHEPELHYVFLHNAITTETTIRGQT